MDRPPPPPDAALPRTPTGLPLAIALLAVVAAGILAFVLAPLIAEAIDLGAAWTGAVAWLAQTQRALHQALATAMRAVQEQGATAGLSLVVLSLLYGIFHAAGPGHGKVVITTYLATQKETLARGIGLAVAASLLQGLVAIVAVFATVLLFEQTARQSRLLAERFELLSFGLVAALGAFLVWRHGRNLLRPRHRHICGGCGHDHHHHHHAPPPTRAWLASILSVGLRPCSGAILVLVLAIALDLRLAGIAAVLAMAIGTAATVSAMAALAVYARDRAGRLAGHLDRDERRLARLADSVGLAGGLLLVLMGLALLQAGLTAPVHPLMRG